MNILMEIVKGYIQVGNIRVNYEIQCVIHCYLSYDYYGWAPTPMVRDGSIEYDVGLTANC